MNLLSDQVSQEEVDIIIRELKKVIDGGVRGDVVEFGCYVGTTSVYLARHLISTGQRLYVYDSFEGLPEKTKEDISPLGGQFDVGELFAAKKLFVKNITQARVPMPIIKKAWFSDLTPGDVPNNIAFAFLDGDYYDSIKSSLKIIESNMSHGAVIIVDDYGNPALPGATKAIDEWLVEHRYSKKVERSLMIIQIPH